VLYALVAILSAGCYTVHQGQFLAEPAAGWKLRQGYGSSFFHYPTKGTPSWYIQMGEGYSGKFNIRIYSDEYDPFAIWKFLSFSGKPIRIKFLDQNRKIVISADGFQTLDGQDLDIGSSKDFIVISPSFKIGNNVVPELSAHMHWSNGKYRVWQAELM
jgi:hypothetical protein